MFTHPRENTTKEFISSVVSDNLPPEALEHLELHDQWIAGTAPLVRLKFTGQSTDEPVVAGLVRRFNLDVRSSLAASTISKIHALVALSFILNW